MTQEIFTIKEAAKKVHVESHVLRYWEEELGLVIHRNEQGHRFYTKEDVELLDKIRGWKGQGLQLKAIRLMLSEDGKLSVPQEVVKEAQAMMERRQSAVKSTALAEEILVSQEGLSKAARMQMLLENLVTRAVEENSEKIMKELECQFRQLEENAQAREQRHWEREEEHYRKLDELLCQRGRRRDKRKKHSKN